MGWLPYGSPGPAIVLCHVAIIVRPYWKCVQNPNTKHTQEN